MAIKKGNKILQITLPPFHQKKLAMICNKTGLNNSAVVQRWIEGHDLFDKVMSQEASEQKKQGA